MRVKKDSVKITGLGLLTDIKDSVVVIIWIFFIRNPIVIIV